MVWNKSKLAENTKRVHVVESYTGKGKPLYVQSVPEPVMSITATSPKTVTYEHEIIRKIPIISKLSEFQETKEEAQARRTGERLKELEEIKIQELRNKINNQNALERARIAQEEARAHRMRG